MELKLIEFIKGHKDNWRELLKEPPYCLTINEDDNYAIFKYSQVESDFNEQICRECRGLIIDKNTLEPIALSFIKFFNVQETFADTINWNKARVQEKVDGSKMLVWWNKYTNKWQVSTSSQLDAYKARVGDFNITFGNLFDRALVTLNLNKETFENMLDPNFCYTFELVSPESRVVVPYKDTKIYFIGARYVPYFNEVNPDSFEHICKVIPRPKEYLLTNLKSCLEATEKMGFDEEGFVVVDNNWHRVKIKSPAYVTVHRVRSNISLLGIVDLFLNEQLDDFISIFPEYRNYVDEIIDKYKSLNNTVNEGMKFINSTKFDCRKDLALYIIKNYDSKIVSAFFYLYDNKGKKFKDWFIDLSDRKKKDLLGILDKENNIEEDE